MVSMASLSLELGCHLPVDKLFDVARLQLLVTALNVGNEVVLAVEKVHPARLVAARVITLPPSVETTFMYALQVPVEVIRCGEAFNVPAATFMRAHMGFGVCEDVLPILE